MIDSMGGRKLAALLGAVLIGCGLVLWKGDVPAGFLDLLKYGLGFFVAGNAAEHVAGAWSANKPQAPGVPDEDMPAFYGELPAQEDARLSSPAADHSEQLARIEQALATVQETLHAIIKKAWG
jgi:hypothetical protein